MDGLLLLSPKLGRFMSSDRELGVGNKNARYFANIPAFNRYLHIQLLASFLDYRDSSVKIAAAETLSSLIVKSSARRRASIELDAAVKRTWSTCSCTAFTIIILQTWEKIKVTETIADILRQNQDADVRQVLFLTCNPVCFRD